MSLDDLYNHLKVYEFEVKKKSEPNSQNMAFISLAKHSRGNEDVKTASVSTASTNVPTASASIGKKRGKKISIQGSDVARFDKSKVECFNCHKMGYFTRKCRAPRSQDRGRRDNYKQGSKVKEHAPKVLMAINGVGWDWSYMANDEEDHALVTDEEAPTEFFLMANTSAETKVFNNSLCFKDCKKNNDSLNCPEFVLKKKACFNCGDFTHLANDCRKRVKGGTTRPVGHRPHGHPVRPSMNCARPNRSFFNIHAHSYKTRPFHKTTAVKNQYRAPWVPTVHRNNSFVNRNFSTGRRNFPTANRKFPTASRKSPTDSTKIHTADMGRKGKAVKSSACWIWKPSQNLSNKGPNNNSVSVMLKKYTYIDTQGRLKSGSSQNNIDDKGYWDSGCSRHMTGNISYLFEFKPFDEGYVSFGQGGCKITGKGTIKTECIVLGRDFKLLNDANILLRTPRQHNMYSINLNNIFPHKDLTCLVAKASADECMLWHRWL
nr:ribonuclease H-like domain-containing protein [Tanacetum cinerariifolium]